MNVDPTPYFARTEGDPLTSAFADRPGGHPGGKMCPLASEEISAHLTALTETRRTGKSAAYLHIPFCETHCLYCGFYRKRYDAEESRSFSDSLIRELELWQETPLQQSTPIHAVYLGGGTPTALEAEDLRRILAAVRRTLPLANDCEITVEGRIHNFDDAKMEACFDQGVNRFSLGVQSFHSELRQSMNRLAPRDELIDRLQRLKSFDQAAIVIDLIYGFPGQTEEMWQNDIATFHSLELDGADLYQLQVFPGTPLFTAIRNEKLPPALTTTTRAHLYDRGCSLMEGAQYRRLSVNHWGRTTRERNIYNHLMRSPAHCIPFGPGAGGSCCGLTLMNEGDIAAWQQRIDRGEKAVKMAMRQGEHHLLQRTITAEFELCRINPARLGDRFHLPLDRCFAPLFDQWVEAGLLQREGEWLRLTRAGEFWQTNLSQYTLNFLQSILEEKS